MSKQTKTPNHEPIKVGSKKIGFHRNGKRRLWIEGKALVKAGFNPYQAISVTYEENEGKTLVWIVILAEPVSENAQFKVSGSFRDGVSRPIIDICNQELTSYMEGRKDDNLKISFFEDCILIEEAENER